MTQRNGRVARLLFGVLLAVALGLGGWTLTQTSDHAARLAAAEARLKASEELQATTREWLIRIEAKLDRVLERQP